MAERTNISSSERKRSPPSPFLLAVWAAVSIFVCYLAAQSRSVLDGVYTKAQADRGDALYHDVCYGCHASTATGGDTAPQLSGDGFVDHWKGKTVADLFQWIHDKMPADSPGSLNPAECADIVAYLMAENGFPTGQQELSREPGALKEIRIEPKK